MRRSPGDEAARLSAWNLELYAWWALYNTEFLDDTLRRPIIQLTESRTHLGEWDGQRRMLGIARRHVENDPWVAVTETLRHEMAHQFVDEVLGVRDEAPHGPRFVTTCGRLRIDPHATGDGRTVSAPATAAAGDTNDHGIRRVILKLLSLAGSPNEHEAQAAMKKARQLLVKYNLEQGDLEGQRTYAVRQLGEVKARRQAWEDSLALILSDYFFVEVIWTHGYDTRRLRSGRVLEIYGTPVNLDLAEYVHGYLSRLLPLLWERYRHEQGITSNRDRLRYFAGVAHGLWKKLRDQDMRLRQERALVWKADPHLRQFFRHYNPRIRHGRGHEAVLTQAWHDGVEAGRRVTIRRPLSERGGSTRGFLPEG